MADFFASTWNEDDDLNTALAPNGMPPGTQASHLYGIVRNLMGASVRDARMTSPFETTTGTQPAYVLTYDQFNGLNQYQRISFKVHAANAAGAATLNINSTGARAILSPTGLALTANQLTVGQIIDVVYNGTSFVMVNSPSDSINAGTQQRLSNKEFVDNSVFFVDQGDVTKRIAFDAGTLPTGTTRTFSVPNASGEIIINTSAQTLAGKTLTSPVINTPTVNGGTINGTIAGTPTYTGDQSIDAALLIGPSNASGFLRVGRIDSNSSSPRIDFNSGATTVSYDARIGVTGGTGVSGGGTLNFQAGAIQWNSQQLATTSTAQTFTNKTITGGTINGTIAGNPTYSGLQTISASNATTQTEYLRLSPTNMGVGNPYLTIQKAATAGTWNISLFDTTTNAGTINFASGSLTWNGGQLVDVNSSQQLGNKLFWDNTTYFMDNLDSTKRANFEVGNGASGNRTLTLPPQTGVIPATNQAQTWTGQQTFGSLPTLFSAGANITGGNLTIATAGNGSIEMGRVDGTSSTPFIDLHSSGNNTDYDVRILASGGNASVGQGTLAITAGGGLTLNGNPIVTTSSGNQTIAGAKTFTNSMAVTAGTGTTQQAFFSARPTNYGTGIPAFNISKASAVDQWNLEVYDNQSNSGIINVVSTFLTHNNQLVYDRGNILGTVTQASGVPTGAIIETGGTSASRYTRYADGTQICTGSVQLTQSTASRLDGVVNFGANMITNAFTVGMVLRPANNTGAVTTIAANCAPGLRELNTPLAGSYASGGFTTALYSIQGAPNFGTSDYVWSDYIAVGRWF